MYLLGMFAFMVIGIVIGFVISDRLGNDYIEDEEDEDDDD